jgi:hypothetical protein
MSVNHVGAGPSARYGWQHLAENLCAEVTRRKENPDPEHAADLDGLHDAIAGADVARVALVRALERMQQEKLRRRKRT